MVLRDLRWHDYHYTAGVVIVNQLAAKLRARFHVLYALVYLSALQPHKDLCSFILHLFHSPKFSNAGAEWPSLLRLCWLVEKNDRKADLKAALSEAWHSSWHKVSSGYLVKHIYSFFMANSPLFSICVMIARTVGLYYQFLFGSTLVTMARLVNISQASK